jgi:ribosomal protein S6--L-glutamate ligase
MRLARARGPGPKGDIMKVGILGWDHGERDPDTPGLAEAGRRRGHETSVFTLEEISHVPARNGYELMLGPEPAASFDAVISRADLSVGRWQDRVERLALVSSVPGLAMFDPAEVWVASQSKFRTIQRLAEQDVPTPPTRGCTSLEDVAAALAEWGRTVVKQSSGYGGTGVELVTDLDADKAMLEDLFGRYGTLLAQPYMETAQGEYRIVVADGRPGYQLLKVPAPGQFKCNLNFGATIDAVDAPPEVLDLAVRACLAMGLTLGGADILPTPDGPVVLEVNEVPGKLGFVGEETRQQIFDSVYGAVERRTPEIAAARG